MASSSALVIFGLPDSLRRIIEGFQPRSRAGLEWPPPLRDSQMRQRETGIIRYPNPS